MDQEAHLSTVARPVALSIFLDVCFAVRLSRWYNRFAILFVYFLVRIVDITQNSRIATGGDFKWQLKIDTSVRIQHVKKLGDCCGQLFR
jgi:hypothetical protein